MLKSVCEFVPAALTYFSRAVSEMASLAATRSLGFARGLLVDQKPLPP